MTKIYLLYRKIEKHLPNSLRTKSILTKILLLLNNISDHIKDKIETINNLEKRPPATSTDTIGDKPVSRELNKTQKNARKKTTKR